MSINFVSNFLFFVLFLTFKVNKIFGHIFIFYFYFCWIWLRDCIYRIFTVYIFWINFYWSIFAYNIVLVSVVEQSGSAISIHISPLFLFPSHLSHHRALNRVPELYGRFSIAICFILSISSVYVNPNFPIHSTSPSHIGVHTLVLYIWVSISALQIRSSISFFYIPHICININ